MKFNLYIYKFSNKEYNVTNEFSKYRLNKIKNSSNDFYIKKNIQIEKVINHIMFLSDKLKSTYHSIKNKHISTCNKYLNISHNDEYLVVIYDKKNIGIDIECMNRNIKIINKEISDIRKWTIMESYVKYFGTSIFKDLDSYIITENMIYNLSGRLWYKTLEYKNNYISVATNSQNFEINLIEVNI